MRFRSKFVEGFGYFAQVKLGFLSGWKTIGKHVNGYGLYDEAYVDYPLVSCDEAVERCICYKKWARTVESRPVYLELEDMDIY